MAVSQNVVFSGSNELTVDVIATADADVAAAVPHNFGTSQIGVILVPLAAEFFLSTWFVASVTATTINLTKANAVGSGAAGAQVRVLAFMAEGQSR